MTALLLVLSIIDSLLKLAVISAAKMTPEQLAPFLERHEAAMAFWQGLAERFREEKP